QDEVFEEMAEVYPELSRLQELRSALNQLKNDGGFEMGSDGRNRTSLWPFGTSTGRNAPSTTKYVFGKSIGFRSFIKPDPGWAVALVDWCQQEPSIAAVKSQDHNLIQACQSGDIYSTFAKQAGAMPAWGTKDTHKAIRDLFKECFLAVSYSMGEHSLARRLK